MTEGDHTVIPARKGVAVRMERNQVARVITYLRKIIVSIDAVLTSVPELSGRQQSKPRVNRLLMALRMVHCPRQKLVS